MIVALVTVPFIFIRTCRNRTNGKTTVTGLLALKPEKCATSLYMLEKNISRSHRPVLANNLWAINRISGRVPSREFVKGPDTNCKQYRLFLINQIVPLLFCFWFDWFKRPAIVYCLYLILYKFSLSRAKIRGEIFDFWNARKISSMFLSVSDFRSVNCHLR